ncbi:MAG: nucleotidyltransferase domain-containing protein [Acidobacteriota bacterium]
MRDVFTNFATSRFLDRDAVVDLLTECAARLRKELPAVKAVYLFGSFASGTPTPRSDADVALEISDGNRDELRLAAQHAFSSVPLPVDLFILTSDQLKNTSGIAGEIARTARRLA